MAQLGVEGWQLQCGEVLPDCILDLRTEAQFSRGRLEASRNLPYNRFQAEAEALTLGGGLILLVDEGGARAAEMAVWLGARDRTVHYLVGGLSAWRGPLESA
jgi:rhodanese-related sulfurtransferase